MRALHWVVPHHVLNRNGNTSLTVLASATIQWALHWLWTYVHDDTLTWEPQPNDSSGLHHQLWSLKYHLCRRWHWVCRARWYPWPPGTLLGRRQPQREGVCIAIQPTVLVYCVNHAIVSFTLYSGAPVQRTPLRPLLCRAETNILVIRIFVSKCNIRICFQQLADIGSRFAHTQWLTELWTLPWRAPAYKAAN